MKLFLLEAQPKDSASWLGIWQLLHWPSGIQILEVRWSNESEGNVLSLFPVSWRHSIGHLIWRDTIPSVFFPFSVIDNPLSRLEKSVENHSWYILLFRRQVRGQLILLTGCLLEHVASAGLGMVGVGSSCGRICCDNIGIVYVTEISVAQSTFDSYMKLYCITLHCVALHCIYISLHLHSHWIRFRYITCLHTCIYAFIQIAFTEFFNRICLATFWNFNSREHGCSSLI